MDHAAQPAGARPSDTGTLLLLSLKLILLAFFILLNALSEIEEDRAKVALESVNRTFSGKIQFAPPDEPHPGNSGVLLGAETPLEDIGGLFAALIPSTRRTEIRRADTLQVEFDARELFRDGEAELLLARAILVRRLARTLMRDHQGGQRFELEVSHGTSGATEDASLPPEALTLEVKRVGLLARRLQAQGLPPEALSVGVLPEHPGILRVTVRATAAAIAGSGAKAHRGE